MTRASASVYAYRYELGGLGGKYRDDGCIRIQDASCDVYACTHSNLGFR
jgi:hypothetical protein